MPAAEVKEEIEINSDFKSALELIDAGRNVFVTGRAGTGKSTFLQHFIAGTKKKAVVLAPTGVAAVNVGGQTIHSFFALAPGVTAKEAGEEARGRKNIELFKKTEAFVIDEVSMVRADLMDCIDVFLRTALRSEKPFAGKQMVFIGDLYQLPPVVTGEEKKAFGTHNNAHYKSQYFFDADVMQGLEFTLIEFGKVYRQSDRKFIELLNRIRNKTADEPDLKILNSRALRGAGEEDGCIHLVTTNRMADDINFRRLSKIRAQEYGFRGFVEGKFGMDALPAELLLRLKAGAQVMFLANDQMKRWVNGTIGTITAIEGEKIRARLAGGKEVEVTPHVWELFRYRYDHFAGAIEKESVGAFTQMPLRLAWAITIHKSQGKTFDNAVIDVGRGTFTHGQMYVALSRCRALEGLRIKTPIRMDDIMLDWRIVKFLTRFQYAQAEKNTPEKREILHRAIKNGSKLRIVYLRPNDEKSTRVITPLAIKQMEYLGHEFEGLEAYCHTKRGSGTFKVERILEIGEAGV
ncbi:MAG: AAA family ATPase [Candidatus Diapherotrites archaeon]